MILVVIVNWVAIVNEYYNSIQSNLIECNYLQGSGPDLVQYFLDQRSQAVIPFLTSVGDVHQAFDGSDRQPAQGLRFPVAYAAGTQV